MSETILAVFLENLGAIICSVITGVLSFLASRYQCKKEIDKLKIKWEHQQILQAEQSFSRMVSLVNAQFDNLEPNPEAIAAVLTERSKASGMYAQALDELILAMESTQFVRIPSALRKVVEARSEWLAANQK